MEDRPTVVGYLEYTAPPNYQLATRAIHLETTLLIGRSIECDLTFIDVAISSKHIRIYSIIYDKNDNTIKPFIYAEDLSSNGTYWNGSYMGKGNGGTLLMDGDELRLSPRISLKFRTSLTHVDESLPVYQQAEVKHFQREYRISDRHLGTGAHGKVYMALNLLQGYQVACKIVDLKKIRIDERRSLKKFMASRDKTIDNGSTSKAFGQLSKTRVKKTISLATSKLEREVEILKSVSHPNIVRLERVYKSNNTLYLFEELVTGGDLFSYVEHRDGRLHEAEAGGIIRQVLEAVNYLHKKEIVHRDIKPDNILVSSLAEGARIVLTDFGNAFQSKVIGKEGIQRMNTLAGTLEYAAPEIQGANEAVHQKGYTKAVDMWSIGCVTTALLIGSTPFAETPENECGPGSSGVVTNSISPCDLQYLFKADEWIDVGERAKDFVLRLLLLDESKRMTASQAIQHHWFTNKRVKQAFDAVYDQAVAGWKRKSVPVDVVKTLPGSAIPSPQSSPPKLNQRTPRPVEPHYHPYHRRLDILLSSRPKPRVLDINNTKKRKRDRSCPRSSKLAGDYSARRDRSGNPPKSIKSLTNEQILGQMTESSTSSKAAKANFKIATGEEDLGIDSQCANTLKMSHISAVNYNVSTSGYASRGQENVYDCGPSPEL